MIRKALKRVRNHPAYLYSLFGIDIALGSHNVVIGIDIRIDGHSPAWFGDAIIIAGIISISVGAIGAWSVKRQRALKKREQARNEALKQANLERQARKRLRRPSSRATVALMHAFECVRSEKGDSTFQIANFSKLRDAEEQIVDDYFGRVQPLLMKFSNSYPPHVRAEAQLELELAALSSAWDVYYIRTINKSIEVVG